MAKQETKQVSVRMSKTLHMRLRKLSLDCGVSLNDMLVEGAKLYVANQRERKAKQ